MTKNCTISLLNLETQLEYISASKDLAESEEYGCQNLMISGEFDAIELNTLISLYKKIESNEALNSFNNFLHNFFFKFRA